MNTVNRFSKMRGICVHGAETDEERSSVREQRSGKLEHTQSKKRELVLEASVWSQELYRLLLLNP